MQRIIAILEKEKVYGIYRGLKSDMDEEELIRLLRYNKVLSLAESVIMVLLILPLISLPVLLSTPNTFIETFRASMMLYNILIFVIMFVVAFSLVQTLQEFKFLDPLLHLPMDMNDLRKLIFLNLLHDARLILIIPILYGVVVAAKTRLPLVFLLVVGYGFVSIFLASGLSMIFSSIIGLNKKVGKGFKSKAVIVFRNMFFVISVLLIGILYELYSFMGFLFEFTGRFTEFLSVAWFLYPFSASEGVIMSRNFNGFLISLFICLIYLVMSKTIFERAFNRFLREIVHPTYEVSIEKTELSVPRIGVPWNSLNIALKDFKILFRDPRSAYILILPLYLVIGYLPALVWCESFLEFRTTLCALSMSLFIVWCIISPLIPYQLLELESGRIWLLFSSGVSKREVALSKVIVTSISYIVCAVSLGIISSILIRDISLFIYSLSGLMILFTVSLLSMLAVIPRISVDTRVIGLSLIKALMLIVMASIVSLPLIFITQFIDPGTQFYIFSKKSYSVLLTSLMEFIVVFAVFNKLIKKEVKP